MLYFPKRVTFFAFWLKYKDRFIFRRQLRTLLHSKADRAFHELALVSHPYTELGETFIGLFTTLWISASSGSPFLPRSLQLLEGNADSMYYK